MNISEVKLGNTSFKGLLTISGPNKEVDVTINTDNVSAIFKSIYFDKMEDAALGVGVKRSAVIAMNDGTRIKTFLPTETVIDAYTKAKTTDYKLDSNFDPLVTKGWSL